MKTKTAALLLLFTAFPACAREAEESLELDDPIHAIAGHLSDARLTVVAEPGTTVPIVSVRRTWVGKTPALADARVEDGVLLLDTNCDDAYHTECHLDLEIAIDPSTDVLFTGTNVDIEFEGLSGIVDVDVTTGELDGWQLSSPYIRALTGSGNIDLDTVRAPELLEARTARGDLDVRVPSESYDIEAIGTASIEGLTDDPTAEASITAIATGGTIRLRGV